MKLIEALEIANAPQNGPRFSVMLACGFTPLHLQTAVKAHFRRALSSRTIVVTPGIYGDLAGSLENGKTENWDCILVTLEWADLDPRLGWRTTGSIAEAILQDAKSRLDRIASAIVPLAEKAPVILALPSVPLPPVFHTGDSELHRIDAALRSMVFGFAAATPAVVLRPERLSLPSHDLRSELATGFPYLFAYADSLASAFVAAAIPCAPKKGLISDLDETMWKGILGDDGPEGISWSLDDKTAFHASYQQLLNSLAESGTLVGIASKNDDSLVKQALARSDLILQPDRIFPIEAHWKPKSESVRRILEAWNIAPDSVVFVDDSPLELEEVKSAFPPIECVGFRKDDPAFLIELRNHFVKRAVLEEDALRSESLRVGTSIRQTAGNAGTYDALLAGANAKITFRWQKRPEPRALELINKTNQFNLNGIRFSEAEWNQFVDESGTRVVIAEYEDRFGKLGKIAVIAGREDAGAFCVHTWVMSCRAFSRRIEHQCLKALFKRWNRVELKFKQTTRNSPVQDFLSQIGNGEPLTRQNFEKNCPKLFHETEVIDD